MYIPKRGKDGKITEEYINALEDLLEEYQSLMDQTSNCFSLQEWFEDLDLWANICIAEYNNLIDNFS